MLSDNALKAFTVASGVSANHASLIIRTSLLALFFIWAAWTVLELMKYHKQHSREHISALFSNYIQLFFLVSIVIALVFVP